MLGPPLRMSFRHFARSWAAGVRHVQVSRPLRRGAYRRRASPSAIALTAGPICAGAAAAAGRWFQRRYVSVLIVRVMSASVVGGGLAVDVRVNIIGVVLYCLGVVRRND